MTSTPASRATPAPEREAQLLSIGKQCSEATCFMVDFLPFKCQHCQQSFCQEHFKVDAHRCLEYDESKHDRVAPNCKAVLHSCIRPGWLNDSFFSFLLKVLYATLPLLYPWGKIRISEWTRTWPTSARWWQAEPRQRRHEFVQKGIARRFSFLPLSAL